MPTATSSVSIASRLKRLKSPRSGAERTMNTPLIRSEKLLRDRSWVLRILLFLTVGCSGTPESAPGRTTDVLAGLERRGPPNGRAIVVKEEHRLPTLSAIPA